MNNKIDVKVAWLTPVVGVDGRLFYWERLYKEFSALFSELRVFTLEFTGEWKNSDIILEKCGFYKRLYNNERHVSAHKEGYVSGISFSPPYVVRRLKAYKPDLIVASEFGLFTFYALVYARFINKTPVLLLVEARPKFNDIFVIGILRNLFRRLILLSVNAIITNNNDGFEYLRDNFSVDREKIVVKPYLVSNMSAIKKNIRKKAKNEAIRFVYIGGIHKRKGLKYAISAFTNLLPKYKNKFVFDIVGDGLEKESMIAETDLANLSSHIKFHGRQNYNQLSKFYDQSDVFVFPSLADYRALVTFEAITSGLAIVGSKYDGGSLETVQEGVNGYIVDPRNIEEFSDRLIQFMEHPELIESFSKKSLEINNQYTYENAGSAVLEASKLALVNFGA